MSLEKIIMEKIKGNDELQGTEQIALSVNARYKNWMVTILRRLEARGEITIITSSGGRGNKTIYRRNRNSPGQPRKLPRNP